MARRGKMAKKNKERRSYTAEFKTEAVALAEKKEKPISQVAKDLGLNENVLRRWIYRTKDAEGTNIRVFPGHGRARDAEWAIEMRDTISILKFFNVLYLFIVVSFY
jgi:transposase